MIMTGINGKNNNLKDSIVLYDSSIELSELEEIQNKLNIKIISLDHQSSEILQTNNFSYSISDDFLDDIERKNIQNTAFQLSNWFNDEKLLKFLIFRGVNLGSLVKSELINILVNFLKNFYTIYKITKKFESNTIICSKKFSNFAKNFSNNVTILETKNIENLLPLDELETNINLGLKNLNLKLSVNRINQLKSLSENFSNILLKPKINKNSKFFLLSEFNTKKFSKLFENMPNFDTNYVIYNRRQPSIWDKESLSIIKNSHCTVENPKNLDSRKNKSHESRKSVIKKIIENLKIYENDLSKIFFLYDLPFWNSFKNIFFLLIEKRFDSYSREVILSENLIKKYDFNGILVQNEVGPNEQILIQLGKLNKIPIYLLQHGINWCTNEAFQLMKHHGVMGYDVDYQLVWGNIDYNYRKKQKFDNKKIIKIGNPAFDSYSKYNSTEKKYILLATSGPTQENIFHLSQNVIKNNIETIKKIAEIINSLNYDLKIKIHPSPDEFDPTEIMKKINPNIEVIKSGNISDLIKNSSLVIVIDFSTVILDAYLLKKPIISIPVKNEKFGVPIAFSNNSCVIANIENLESSINSLLKKEYIERVEAGTRSLNEYMSNLGSSSKKLLSTLNDTKYD